MENYDELIELINNQAKILVGTLCKRVEVLEKEKVLTPKLFKALIKENVYESFRSLKKLIEVKFKIGKLEFRVKPRE